MRADCCAVQRRRGEVRRRSAVGPAGAMTFCCQILVNYAARDPNGRVKQIFFVVSRFSQSYSAIVIARLLAGNHADEARNSHVWRIHLYFHWIRCGRRRSGRRITLYGV